MTLAVKKKLQRRKWKLSAFNILTKTASRSGVYCVVTSHVVSEECSYAWDFRPYYREDYCQEHGLSFKSKNDLALEMIEAFPAAKDEQVYVLMDSWYTSEKVINACNRKGFHVIAAIKTNRHICVSGVTISIADFAIQYLRKSDLHSVTVEGQGTYWIYDYEGPLSEMENVKALLSWKDEYADSSKPQVCLLCTDQSMDLVTIQRYYHVRWNIETGYRYSRNCWALISISCSHSIAFSGFGRFSF